MVRYILIVLALVLCLSLPAAAGSFTADFNSGADSRLISVPDQNGAVGVSYTGGQAVFSVLPPYTTAQNWTSGWTGLLTSFDLLGDYKVSVLLDPSAMQETWPNLASAVLGVGPIGMWYASGTLFAYDNAGWSASLPLSLTSPFTIEMQRVGSNLFFYYDLGSGLQLLGSEAGISTGQTDAVSIGFWGGGGPNSAAFDNLQIQADGFQAPEPATWSLGAAALLGLTLYRRRGRKSA